MASGHGFLGQHKMMEVQRAHCMIMVACVKKYGLTAYNFTKLGFKVFVRHYSLQPTIVLLAYFGSLIHYIYIASN